MNKNLTELVIIVDRSGSMQSIKDDAEGGINQLIEAQKKDEGECHFTLAQFDTQHDLVNDGTDIQKVEPFTLVPRGGTALYDAIGITLNAVGERLSKTPEEQRPGLVSVVIVTDGYENSSGEFDQVTVKKMIEEQTNKYKWEFSYLGADQDAFAVGRGIGVANSVTYGKSKSSEVYRGVSGRHTRMKNMVSSDQAVVASYTSAELKAMNE